MDDGGGDDNQHMLAARLHLSRYRISVSERLHDPSNAAAYFAELPPLPTQVSAEAVIDDLQPLIDEDPMLRTGSYSAALEARTQIKSKAHAARLVAIAAVG